MYKYILPLYTRPFIRNVFAITSSVAVAQAITFAFSPIITRLYGPEVFGIQAAFMSLVGILGGVAALTYPIAIVLPKNDDEAISLVKISIFSGVVVTTLITIVLGLFGPEIFSSMKIQSVSPYMYWIPVFVLLAMLNQVVNQWASRKNAFTLIGAVRIKQAVMSTILKTGLGFVYPKVIILIISNLISGLLGAILIYSGLQKANVSKRGKTKPHLQGTNTWEIAKQHGDFPTLRAPHELLNSISQSLPILMLTAFFGASSAGHYSIALVVLGIPMALIGTAVTQVFYPRISTAFLKGEDVRKLIIKTTFGLGLIGAPLFLAVIIAGPVIFAFIFGSEWRMAGVYGQWLSLWLFFQYINKPAVAAIPVLRLQKGLLIYELFSTTLKIAALYIGYMLFQSDIVAIALFSVFGVLSYLWLILWVIFRSK